MADARHPCCRTHRGSGGNLRPESFSGRTSAKRSRKKSLGAPQRTSTKPFLSPQPPTARNYLRALASGLAATPEKERYLRTRLWWVSNDPVRRGKTAPPPPDEWKENLRCLRNLLDVGVPDQRLMAAEICCESGEFTAAKEMLQFRFPAGFRKAVDLIKKLSEAEDLTVREIA